MKSEIDARGLSCPQPVILAKNKMRECGEFSVTVDNKNAVENLSRLAAGSGWSVLVSAAGNDFIVNMSGNKIDEKSAEKTDVSCTADLSFIVVLSSDVMGKGDDELGELLMKAFLHTLASSGDVPQKVLFYNSGIKLAAEGSDVLDDLAALENAGSELLVCGTCVNYFNLGGKLRAGKISNMFDILESMKTTVRTIRP